MDICDDTNPLKPTPQEIRNEIRLLREDHKYLGSFVLVEGSNDSRLYKKFFDKKKSLLRIACGKQKIIESFALLNGTYDGFIGIGDADFDRFLKKPNPHPNLFLTELHDIESIILCSNALESVLSEYADDEKLEKFQSNNGRDIRQVLVDNALYIGYLRLYSTTKGKSWNFKNLPFSVFISEKTLELNRASLHAELQKINYLNPIQSALLQRLSNIFDEKIPDNDGFVKDAKANPWQICNGHDLIRILHLAFIRKIGNLDRISKWKDSTQLEEYLRIAYNEHLFKTTCLFSSICQWEKQNTSFNILNVSHNKK